MFTCANDTGRDCTHCADSFVDDDDDDGDGDENTVFMCDTGGGRGERGR